MARGDGYVDLRVACNPADVGHAREFIVWVHVEHILDSQGGTEEIASGRMHHTFGLARGSGCLSLCEHRFDLNLEVAHVEDEQRIFGCHDLRWAVVRYLCDLIVPPFIPSLSPRHFIASPLENKYMLDNRALFEGSIDDHLGSNCFATSLALVTGNDHTRATILNTVTQRFR